ncbi:MAG: hypothetical protein ACR2NL_04235 [Acidimicrobiia bacterium]
MIPDTDAPFCAEVAGSYTVALVDNGDALDAAVERDDCGPRRADLSLGLTRVSEAGS